MPTSTVEQYIKTIYQEQEIVGSELLSMKDLSRAMRVAPGTATAMVKHLHAKGLVSYQPRKGVALTERGTRLALQMLRRHRLIETFLEQVLDYDWSEIHDDAERLEHAVSETFIERLDAYLDHPESDPHGDPIPSASGRVKEPVSRTLNSCKAGRTYCVTRLVVSNPEFLSMMKERHLVPGERIVLEESNRAVGILTVRHTASDSLFSLGWDLGANILVTT